MADHHDVAAGIDPLAIPPNRIQEPLVRVQCGHCGAGEFAIYYDPAAQGCHTEFQSRGERTSARSVRAAEGRGHFIQIGDEQ